MFWVLALFFLSGIACQQVPSPDSHEVTSLPGYASPLRTKQYAGYIDVGSSKSLYYYFVLSERDIRTAPLVLWLNGGPGCSSFCGFVYEHGPYLYKLDDGNVTLTDNPFSWHKVANMIYLDSPAGVGMSYSPDKHQYTTNDTQTAIDANIFVRKFLTIYPEFQTNEFYIAGESYGGVYVPNLAFHVMEQNGLGLQTPSVNLKGYLVGNGCTDPQFDADAFPLFALGKSLISVDLYNDLMITCKGDFLKVREGSQCETLLLKMQYELADLNLYDILETCYYPPDKPTTKLEADKAYKPTTSWQAQARHLRETHRGWPVQSVMKPGQELQNWQHLLKLDPPCIDSSEAFAWLNLPEVRVAIHAAPVEVTGHWKICTGKIKYTNDVPSMIPIHNKLVTTYGLRALVYSGDHDLCVPHTGSEAWTRSLGYPVVTPWQPWHYKEAWTKQVGGYYVEYQGLTYATVKGAGHMTPQTNPKESFTLFDSFLSRRPLQDAHVGPRVQPFPVSQ